jgi:uncharacterized membrane protein (UPF0127 family)
MMNAIEIMKQAYSENYQGSITELIMQGEAEAMAQEQAAAQGMGMDVASTSEEQRIGLTEGPPRSMAFPNTGGQDFNTMGMDYPIDMQGLDSQGGLVRSYEAVPPGVGNIPMGPKVATVIENPTQYRAGGIVERQLKDLSFSEKIERYRKSKRR